MKNVLCITILIAALALTGCNAIRNEDVGTVIGGVLGGMAGSQVGKGSGRHAATIAGTLAGAAVGGRIGRAMDEIDRITVQRALESSRTGQTVSWRNPNTRSDYELTPTATYGTAHGPCRQFTIEVQIDGHTDRQHGQACRQADGTWAPRN